MNLKQNKQTDLKTAISTYVKPGCHLSIEGFTINRNPMAAVYEIVRQKIKGLQAQWGFPFFPRGRPWGVISSVNGVFLPK